MLTAKQRISLREIRECADEIAVAPEELLIQIVDAYSEAIKRHREALEVYKAKA